MVDDFTKPFLEGTSSIFSSLGNNCSLKLLSIISDPLLTTIVELFSIGSGITLDKIIKDSAMKGNPKTIIAARFSGLKRDNMLPMVYNPKIYTPRAKAMIYLFINYICTYIGVYKFEETCLS